jgi:hypothetical protein
MEVALLNLYFNIQKCNGNQAVADLKDSTFSTQPAA